jgi:hypothetical protein
MLEGAISEKLLLRFEIDYCQLFYNFFFSSFDDEIYSKIDGVADSMYQFNQYSLPVKLCYGRNKLQFHAGLEYALRVINHNSIKTQNISWCLGANYWFSKRFSIGLNYTRGFANKHHVIVYVQEDFFLNQYTEKYNGKGKSRMIDLSLYFILNKKK